MAKIEMGYGFKALLLFVILTAIICTGFVAGIQYTKGKQTESNVTVLSVDSYVAQEITQETKVEGIKVNDKIKKINVIVNNDGLLSTEFMQLVQSTIATAERRGNETGVIHTITKP